MKCTVSPELCLTDMTATNAQGQESFSRFRSEKFNGKWFATQSTRRTALPGAGIVQETAQSAYTTLEGVTLRDEIARSRRLRPARTLEVLRGVCAAVEAAHRRQLVHRALKPENIFIAVGGDGGTVKILDFGVAKLLSPPDDAAGSEGAFETETGVLVGTVVGGCGGER